MKSGFLVILLASSLNTNAFASQVLSGVYQVVGSADCSSRFNYTDGARIKVTATDASIEVKDLGGFGSDFGFKVGHESNVGCPTDGSFCFDQLQTSFDSSYSDGGNKFTAVQTLVDTATDPDKVIHTGQIDLILKGDTLEIDSTTNDQPQPAPLARCMLKKL